MSSALVESETEPRRQVGALPFRRLSDGGFKILLITSRESRRWVIPKGWPMKGRKPYEAAAREAYEEAGLLGEIGKRPLGFYLYEKRLKSRDFRTLPGEGLSSGGPQAAEALAGTGRARGSLVHTLRRGRGCRRIRPRRYHSRGVQKGHRAACFTSNDQRRREVIAKPRSIR